MESWDASDKEAPPTNPRKKDLSKIKQLEAISMLVMTATEDCLPMRFHHGHHQKVQCGMQHDLQITGMHRVHVHHGHN